MCVMTIGRCAPIAAVSTLPLTTILRPTHAPTALPGHGQQQGGAHPTTITTARSVVGNRSFAVAGPRGASAEEQRALSIPTHLSPTSQPRRLVSSPAPISHVHPPTPPLHTDATCHARLGMTRGGSVRGGFVHCGEICVGLIGRSTLPLREARTHLWGLIIVVSCTV